MILYYITTIPNRLEQKVKHQVAPQNFIHTSLVTTTNRKIKETDQKQINK